jgi:predicted nucleic acid-binding protein
VTVVDTSGVVDFLLGVGAHGQVRDLWRDEAELAAPDVLVFETLAVLRRYALRGELDDRRAAGAIADLADLPLLLAPALALRDGAWALRHNLTIADGLFVTLAARLGEPLATKDAALARGAADAGVAVIALSG